MTDLTNIASAIITLIVAVITTFLIPYLKAKVDAEKFAKIKNWVKVAVEAAEMIYNGTGRGYNPSLSDSSEHRLSSQPLDLFRCKSSQQLRQLP